MLNPSNTVLIYDPTGQLIRAEVAGAIRGFNRKHILIMGYEFPRDTGLLDGYQAKDVSLEEFQVGVRFLAEQEAKKREEELKLKLAAENRRLEILEQAEKWLDTLSEERKAFVAELNYKYYTQIYATAEQE